MLERVKNDKVDFISLQFFDLLGVPKEVVIPATELEGAMQDGVWFDGSSIEGFARIQESDLFLRPDIATYALVPWLTENGRTARVICDIYRSDGSHFEDDPRHILKKMTMETKAAGYKFYTGPELEFYLFKKEDPLTTNPLDYDSYFDMIPYTGTKIIKEIISELRHFGIAVEAAHHEVGKGQYEIDFTYGTAVETADKLLTLKYTVKAIAQKHGLRATFMPKPLEGHPGSGMHVHQSLFDETTGKNLFFDPNDKYRLSALAKHFIAGQLRHIKGMCALLNPTINSYKRLTTGFEAPIYITWASMNRSSLIRIPQWFKQKESSARIELRCPDLSSNPYLAFATMLKVGLEGINKKLTPPKPLEENIYELNNRHENRHKIDTLPTSLMEALREMEKDNLINAALGKHLSRKYRNVKMREVGEYQQQVTSWELKKYIDLI